MDRRYRRTSCFLEPEIPPTGPTGYAANKPRSNQEKELMSTETSSAGSQSPVDERNGIPEGGCRKYCGGCKTELPVGEFSKQTRAADGLQSQCKHCNKRYRETRRAEDINRVREETRRNMRNWRAANPGRVRQSKQRWHRADPLKRRLADGARAARRHGCKVDPFDSTDLKLFWLCNGISPDKCFYTGAELGADFHLDHKVPLARGGTHSVDNLVPCDPNVNMQKAGKTAEEYMISEALPA